MTDAAEFRTVTNVSRETIALYETWYTLLTHWNNKINLVSQGTISNFWLRHALDSHQLFSFASKDAKTWLDLGAGAGFPGLSLAIIFKSTMSNSVVTMVEANGKKCNFLRTVIRTLDLPAKVIQARAEDFATQSSQKYDIITARAFAPLPKLLNYSRPFWGVDTLGIFPKGERWQSEVESAQKHWHFQHEARSSQTNPEARILLVSQLKNADKGDKGNEHLTPLIPCPDTGTSA